MIAFTIFLAVIKLTVCCSNVAFGPLIIKILQPVALLHLGYKIHPNSPFNKMLQLVVGIMQEITTPGISITFKPHGKLTYQKVTNNTTYMKS